MFSLGAHPPGQELLGGRAPSSANSASRGEGASSGAQQTTKPSDPGTWPGIQRWPGGTQKLRELPGKPRPRSHVWARWVLEITTTTSPLPPPQLQPPAPRPCSEVALHQTPNSISALRELGEGGGSVVGETTLQRSPGSGNHSACLGWGRLPGGGYH